MTLNHNYGYFSGVGFGIAGNILFPKQTFDYHVINDSIPEIKPLGGVTHENDK